VSYEFTLPGDDLPVVDETRLMSEFGGDPTILAELSNLFMEHVPPLFEEILQALEAEDATALAAHTHSLKGACSTFGAPRLAHVCKCAEMAARQGDVQVVKDNVEALREELDKVCQKIGGLASV
jgi:two-component system sensor histidine kinase/response regulator